MTLFLPFHVYVCVCVCARARKHFICTYTTAQEESDPISFLSLRVRVCALAREHVCVHLASACAHTRKHGTLVPIFLLSVSLSPFLLLCAIARHTCTKSGSRVFSVFLPSFPCLVSLHLVVVCNHTPLLQAEKHIESSQSCSLTLSVSIFYSCERGNSSSATCVRARARVCVCLCVCARVHVTNDFCNQHDNICTNHSHFYLRQHQNVINSIEEHHSHLSKTAETFTAAYRSV